jgi:serine/threonine protein kinase/tetratricopeptide (TPR) repeat protein
MVEAGSQESSRADELFLEYLHRCEQGEEPDFESFCDEHPADADALRVLRSGWAALESIRRRMDEGASVSERLRQRFGENVDPQIDLAREREQRVSNRLLERLREEGPRGTRYQILGEIGRGGMGAVLEIWDEELRRALAMKVVLGKEKTSSEEPPVDPKTLGRFLEEAQITGQLDHPGIVPVHELGLDSTGRVYFTMRLVRGEDLRDVFRHVIHGRNGWSQVRALGVLLKVCEALSFAHSKGVIHRDVKPANVMVGNFGEVYVMDWGLGRVLGREDRHDLRLAAKHAVTTERRDERNQTPDSPLVTVDGTIVGTPSYMPPEQAQGRIQELGPHSDVYSVGAMLYELLTGEMPYVPAASRPSRRAIVEAVVRGEPRPIEEIAPRTPPELVAITEKAMAREISERYPTTLALAEDLRAYLEGRVVAAYETGTWAETRKWVQRNKSLAAALAGVVLAVALGALAFAMEADHALEAAARAERNADRAKRVSDFVQKTLVSSDPNYGGSQRFLVVDAMEAAIAELERGVLREEPQTEADLQLTMSWILNGNGRPEKALELAERALATWQGLVDGDALGTAACQEQVGRCLQELGRSGEALPYFDSALEMRRRRAPDDVVALGGTLSNVGHCLETMGRYAEALPMHETALEYVERAHPGDSQDLERAIINLAGCLQELGRADEALSNAERGLAMAKRLWPGDHPDVVSNMNIMTVCLMSLGRHAEALPLVEQEIEMQRRLFAGDNNEVAGSLGNEGLCLEALGRADEGLLRLEEAMEIHERFTPGDHPETAKCLYNIAFCLRSLDRCEEALPVYQSAIDMFERLHPGDHPIVAVALGDWAGCLESLGRSDDAEPLYARMLEMRKRLFPGDHPDVEDVLSKRASCLDSLGRHTEALPLYEAAVSMNERLDESDSGESATTLANYASCLQSLGRDQEALTYAKRARDIAQRILPEEDEEREQIESVLERIQSALSR